MRRRVRWFGGLSVLGLLVVGTALPLDAAPDAASPSSPPPTDLEGQEIRLRDQFGLRSDLAHVQSVGADPRSTTDHLGIPLTPDEAADIAARDGLTPTVGALTSAAQDLDGFGGIWIDQAAGGVIHLAVAGTWPEETIQRLRALVPAGQRIVLTEVAVSLAELESLQERLADAVLSDPSLREQLVELGLEPQNNAVRLTMLTGTPQELIDRVAQEFGGPGLVLDSAPDRYRAS